LNYKLEARLPTEINKTAKNLFKGIHLNDDCERYAFLSPVLTLNNKLEARLLTEINKTAKNLFDGINLNHDCER